MSERYFHSNLDLIEFNKRLRRYLWGGFRNAMDKECCIASLRSIAKRPQCHWYGVSKLQPVQNFKRILSQIFQGEDMTSYQRARRIATWRGSFIALTFCTGWLLLSALAGTITQ